MQLHNNITNKNTINFFKTLETSYNMLFNNKYDYSKTIYRGKRFNIYVICPVHGGFTLKASLHNNGVGCKLCYKESLITSLPILLSKLQSKHPNYDFSYVTKPTPVRDSVDVICKEHGLFTITLGSLLKGRGCKLCGQRVGSQKTKLPHSHFVQKANIIHNCKYQYGEYNGMRSNIDIKCKIHGWFVQKANDHMNSKVGCQRCSLINKSSGFNSNKPATLYYLSINRGQAYKIGITNRDVNSRYDLSDLEKITVLKQWLFIDGFDAYTKEQKILNEFSYAKWDGVKLLHSGNTELFKYDVLNLDR